MTKEKNTREVMLVIWSSESNQFVLRYSYTKYYQPVGLSVKLGISKNFFDDST